MSPWIRYSLVRLGIFGAVFVLIYLFGFPWWVALIFATILSFTAGYVFFSQTRDQIVQDMKKRAERKKTRHRDIDAEVEDSLSE